MFVPAIHYYYHYITFLKIQFRVSVVSFLFYVKGTNVINVIQLRWQCVIFSFFALQSQ